MNRKEMQSDVIYSNARSLTTDAHEVQCSHNGDGRADDRSEKAGSKEAVNGVDAELRNTSERRDNPNVPDSADGGLRQMGDGDAVETARSGQSHARDFNALHQSDYLKKIILNIPHSSINGIWDKELGGWEHNPHFINDYIQKWTDWHTDFLFTINKENVIPVVFPYSRFVCDAERLINDPQESDGQGIIYTKFGEYVRIPISDIQKERLMSIWQSHQNALASNITEGDIVVDCHSFPSELADVDICIGYNDDWSFDPMVVQTIRREFVKSGYSVGINEPYSNAITPNAPYQYSSVMIEVNKRVYMNEHSMTLNRNSRQWMRWFGTLGRIYDKLSNLDADYSHA